MFLDSDPPLPPQLHRMREYIEEKIAGTPERFGGGWDRAIATSATASALVCAVNRIPRARRDEADRKRAASAQVLKLYGQTQHHDARGAPQSDGHRAQPRRNHRAGAAVLSYVLEAFGLPSVYYSAAGVRDGIVADLAARGVGREFAELSRDQRKEVERIGRKYGVPIPHARKVAELSRMLYASLQPLHGLAPGHGKLLEAAAFLHDVGHYVNDTSHHKHSYYLVANSDLSGFTSRERELIANLCRYHRKAMPAPAHANYLGLTTEEKRAVTLLVPILRLADNLDRSHDQRVSAVNCQVKDGQVAIRVSASGDIDLEQWAAERAAETFRQVYGRGRGCNAGAAPMTEKSIRKHATGEAEKLLRKFAAQATRARRKPDPDAVTRPARLHPPPGPMPTGVPAVLPRGGAKTRAAAVEEAYAGRRRGAQPRYRPRSDCLFRGARGFPGAAPPRRRPRARRGRSRGRPGALACPRFGLARAIGALRWRPSSGTKSNRPRPMRTGICPKRLASTSRPAGNSLHAARLGPGNLHAFRIETKRFRYTLEMFRKPYGKPLDPYLEALRKVQNYLGDINDCATTRALVLDALPMPSPQRRKIERALDYRMDKLIANFLKYWRAEFDPAAQEARWRAFLAQAPAPQPRTARHTAEILDQPRHFRVTRFRIRGAQDR